MRGACRVELLTLRRSRVPIVAGLAVLLAPALLAWAFLAAAQSSSGSPVGVKATALGLGSGWSGYLNGLTQIDATGGFVALGIVAAWCFGREFADGTVVSLYATATSRTVVAAAKLLLVTGWSVVVALLAAPVALAIGLLAGLGTPDASHLAALARLVGLLLLTGLLGGGVGLCASIGRGYLAGIAGLLGFVVAPQLAIVAGIGAWFPWSSPALWALAPLNAALPSVSAGQLLLVPLVALAAGAATLAWWRAAELR